MSNIEVRAEASRPPVRVTDLRKSHGAHRVLSGVTFDIGSGEMLVVLGPSGSGKTTILRLIAGLDRADAGLIELSDQPANDLPPQKRGLGVVFQEHALFQRKTVEQNIAFGLQMRKVERARIRKAIDEMLDLVRLQEHRRKYPSQLSGGQRQRVALARALACHPSVILFDEPFSALDAVVRTELRREVRSLLRSMNVPALFITHDQEEALELADRIAVLNQGEIEQIGTPFEVYNRPRTEFVATFLGAANVMLGRYTEAKIALGGRRINLPPDPPALTERQPVKVVFRPEDVVLNFQPQLLDAPHFLGHGIVENVSYVGPSERLVVRLLFPPPSQAAEPPSRSPRLALVDGDSNDGFPITITRSKWDAGEMELSPGDPVVAGLKAYRLLAHYPLAREKGASTY